MNRVIPSSIRIHVDGYCSQPRKPLPPIRTIEDGVKIIKEILSKSILCRHDVNDINRVYRAIDLLERQVEQIPLCNSQHALEKIIEKVKKTTGDNVGGLISLYHLQNFSDKELPINQFLQKLWNNFKMSSEYIEEVARQLPCCFSEGQFDEDVTSLIRGHRSKKVITTLNRKKEKLRSHEQRKQTIAVKKSELNQLRKGDSQRYPAYLDKLLDDGYIYLYDHLIQMRSLRDPNEQRSEIEKMTFSCVSHVVLETREAVLRRVEDSIPPDRRNVLFLLGATGVGKSTVLCFLRGDKMILKDFRYESQSDKSGCIGHEGGTSCTFLPTIEIVNDLVIVDFSGFDDTNGQIISMGMEFALKALINKYDSKILVLEAIINTGGKYAAVARMGARLSRLLDNKEDCLLGITKYSQDPHFRRIKDIEEQQQKERLAPTAEEIKLKTEIDVLSSLKNPDFQPKIEQMKQQLEKIQQEKEQKLRLPLPVTEEKAESRKKVEEKESVLLKKIGLKGAIPFYDLEDPSYVSSCFTIFTGRSRTMSFLIGTVNLGTIRASTNHLLDSEDEKLLNDRFANMIKEMAVNKTYQVEFEDPNAFKDFEQSVLESSLIQTILSESNPEIGQFLHLPEIDPQIVRKFDRKIVSDCISASMKSVISTLDITEVDKKLKELGVQSSPKMTEFNQKMTLLRNYVMGLLGIPLPADPILAEKKWAQVQYDYQSAGKKAAREFDQLSAPALLGLGIPLCIPLIIRLLMVLGEQNKAKQEVIEKTLDDCCKNLTQMYDTLLRLKELEKIIEKRDASQSVVPMRK